MVPWVARLALRVAGLKVPEYNLMKLGAVVQVAAFTPFCLRSRSLDANME